MDTGGESVKEPISRAGHPGLAGSVGPLFLLCLSWPMTRGGTAHHPSPGYRFPVTANTEEQKEYPTQPALKD
jgi:hypothetical protein